MAKGRPQLTDEMQAELARRQADGASYRDLAAWLLKERDFKVSHETLRKLFGELRDERRQAVDGVVVERLASTVTSDLDRLQTIQDEYRAQAARLDVLLDKACRPFVDDDGHLTIDDKGVASLANAWRGLKDSERASVEQRLKHLGVGTNDAKPGLASEYTDAELRRIIEQSKGWSSE